MSKVVESAFTKARSPLLRGKEPLGPDLAGEIGKNSVPMAFPDTVLTLPLVSGFEAAHLELP